jgi:hypothetical protein
MLRAPSLVQSVDVAGFGLAGNFDIAGATVIALARGIGGRLLGLRVSRLRIALEKLVGHAVSIWANKKPSYCQEGFQSFAATLGLSRWALQALIEMYPAQCRVIFYRFPNPLLPNLCPGHVGSAILWRHIPSLWVEVRFRVFAVRAKYQC